MFHVRNVEKYLSGAWVGIILPTCYLKSDQIRVWSDSNHPNEAWTGADQHPDTLTYRNQTTVGVRVKSRPARSANSSPYALMMTKQTALPYQEHGSVLIIRVCWGRTNSFDINIKVVKQEKQKAEGTWSHLLLPFGWHDLGCLSGITDTGVTWPPGSLFLTLWAGKTKHVHVHGDSHDRKRPRPF